ATKSARHISRRRSSRHTKSRWRSSRQRRDSGVTLGGAARGRVGDVISPLLYRFVFDPVRRRPRAAFVSLRETERWSHERLRERQEQLLRTLLMRAATTSPWYRQRLPPAPDLARFGVDDL